MINRFHISRFKSLLILGGTTYIMGVLALISNIETLKASVTFFGKGFFDILDFMSSSILLPLGGMLISLFVGFFMEKQKLQTLLLPYMSERLFTIWYVSIRYITPLGVLSVMLNKLFF
jgi:NSS family neurotransmitter:Na+ symporter